MDVFGQGPKAWVLLSFEHSGEEFGWFTNHGIGLSHEQGAYPLGSRKLMVTASDRSEIIVLVWGIKGKKTRCGQR
jgi:hypothetical protein